MQLETASAAKGASTLAIIAGEGRLPQALAAAYPDALWVTLTEIEAPAGQAVLAAKFEQLGQMFAAMKAAGIRQVVFAGAIRRPQIDPRQLDAFALSLAQHFARGDDAILREVLKLFEAQGFEVVGASSLLPQLLLPAGTIWGNGWDETAKADAARAESILAALSPLDVGQGAVVAGGLVLGIETIQGTEALLSFVAQTPPGLRRAKGVFVKAPKRGQELRLDMPAIGPDTAAQLARAGIGGIVVEAGGVMVIDAEQTRQSFDAAGLFLVAK